MYLHLGNGVVVRQEDIIAVCDLDNTSQSHRTRRYLAVAERAGQVRNVSEHDLPKSFVVCADCGAQTVYLSPLNSSTLLKRSEEMRLE